MCLVLSWRLRSSSPGGVGGRFGEWSIENDSKSSSQSSKTCEVFLRTDRPKSLLGLSCFGEFFLFDRYSGLERRSRLISFRSLISKSMGLVYALSGVVSHFSRKLILTRISPRTFTLTLPGLGPNLYQFCFNRRDTIEWENGICT